MWAKRLSQRYVETRDPKTGLEGYQFSQCATAWCDDVGKILGDRAQYQYGDDFKGHRVVEGTLFPCYGNTPQIEPQVGRLLLGEALGEQGRDFTRQAVEELTAWGKSAYRAKDNAFIPMLTDGTSMEGYVCKKDGYFGPKGRVLQRRASGGGPPLGLCAGVSVVGRHVPLGDGAEYRARQRLGRHRRNRPKPSPSSGSRTICPTRACSSRCWNCTGPAARQRFSQQAEVIGQNILKQRVHNGWFVPSQRHVYCRVANDESQALLHLAAALMGKPEAIPAFTGAEPFFHAEYGTSTGRVYDSADIYGRTR